MTATTAAPRSCPRCGRVYDKSETQFCLDDGTPLGTLPPPAPLGDDTEVDGFSATMTPPVPAKAGNTALESPTDLQLQPVDDPLGAGARVGEYLIERKIGEGGMGVIFSATHPVIGKRVAIKVLNPQMAHARDVVARFVQEAKSVNQIRHRHIVDIFSFGQLADGRQYFAMELLEGESLAARRRGGPIPPKEALTVLLQVASAIEAAHEKGIVHRDLKPDNIFLCSGGEPFAKVLDFGIAKLLGEAPAGMNVTSTGMPIGTPTYMSPEQAVGAKVDHRADLYSFGVILFEVIAGRPPFEGKTLLELLNKHMNDAPPPLDELAEIDAGLKALVDKLLAKDPAARLPTMGHVMEELAGLRDAAAAEGRGLWAARGASLDRPRPRGRGMLWASALAGVALAAAGVWLFAARKPAEAPPPPPVVIAPPPPVQVAPPAPPQSGRVVLSTNAPATRVYLDKSATERAAEPVATGGMHLKVTIPAGQDFVLRVEADGYKTFTMPIKLEAGDETSMPVLMVPVGESAKPSAGKATKKTHASEPAKPDPQKSTNPNLFNPF